MDSAFIRFGHGYETGSRGRCEAFDGFDVIAAPLGDFDNASRESRIFRRDNGRGGSDGCCYGSHAIKLAKQRFNTDLFILMQHGGGREVLRVPAFYDGGALEAAILAMPERLQYALLYSIWKTAAAARSQAQSETGQKYAKAFVEGRLKKRRRQGRVYIEIESPAVVEPALSRRHPPSLGNHANHEERHMSRDRNPPSLAECISWLDGLSRDFDAEDRADTLIEHIDKLHRRGVITDAAEAALLSHYKLLPCRVPFGTTFH